MNLQWQQFGLFYSSADNLVDQDACQDTACADRGSTLSRRWLGMPASGCGWLALRSDAPPRIEPLDAGERVLASETRPHAPLLAILRHDRLAHLVWMAPPGMTHRVNGVELGPIAVLRAGDQLRVGGALRLHVSVFYRPYIGPPPAPQAGGVCPVCRTALHAAQTVYICPLCEAVLHCGSAQGPEIDRLECAAASSHCPRCRQVLRWEKGYAYVPEI